MEPLRTNAPSARRRRGALPPFVLLERIRRLSQGRNGLFRVHRTHGSLYARARRLFGSWEAAVRAAGCDYTQAVAQARRRSRESQRATIGARRRVAR